MNVEVVYFHLAEVLISLLIPGPPGVYLHDPQYDQLDGSSGVPLLGHGASKCLHGLVVGASQQRLSVYRHQLVVDAQTSIL